MTAVAQRTAGAASDWSTCGRCRVLLYVPRFDRQLRVCADCGHHARLTAVERLDQLLDPGSSRAIGAAAVVRQDPLGFTDVRPYAERLAVARRDTGMEEAVRCVEGTVDGHRVVVAAMDFRFLGGSLGTGVGELITSAAAHALATRTPLLIVSASGGARMQEGVLSLMQMAKTTGALSELDAAGILTVSLLTDPTYGGVAASYATATRVVLAEPGARAGFAGPRVIEQTIGQVLPPGFQTAEFLLEHGLIDAVVPRAGLRGALARLLAAVHGPPGPVPVPGGPAPVTDPRALPEQDPWRTVQVARDPARPTTLDYIAHLTDGFTELRGDRLGEDCPALVGGLARMGGTGVVVLGHQKGHTTRDLVARRFGMPSPAGYRKAARLMRLAEVLGLPLVTFVDTPGAYPGVEAEEHGQAFAIADSLMVMASLRVPVVTVVTGEGGSGGALAVAAGDTVLALSNAVYSVISPEGCAAILWKSPGAAAEAAAALRLGARDLLERGVVDAVLPEPRGGAQSDHLTTAVAVGSAVAAALRDLTGVDPDELVRRRRNRFRRFGLLEVR